MWARGLAVVWLATVVHFSIRPVCAEETQVPAIGANPTQERIPFKPDRSVDAQSSIGTAISVVLLLALLGGGVALYRRNKLGFFLKNNLPVEDKIVVVARKSLMPGVSLTLVKVEGKSYLVGYSASGFTLLDSNVIDPKDTSST